MYDVLISYPIKVGAESEEHVKEIIMSNELLRNAADLTLKITEIKDNRTLAYRNKPSIEIYMNAKEVGFSEFSYSWEEIIAIGRKLEGLLEKDVVDVP